MNEQHKPLKNTYELNFFIEVILKKIKNTTELKQLFKEYLNNKYNITIQDLNELNKKVSKFKVFK